MWNSLPEFGTVVLCAILVAAGYTMAVALAAGAGRPRLLQAARAGAFGTIALVGLAVLVLAYAFLTHDFRLAYVAAHSDRSMTTPWLVAALWGGQDGSLLWWLFLTSFFSAICVVWLRGRYRELQPYVIATLMSVVMFVGVLMLFAANPFSTLVAGPPADGAGLNFQLRNFYMIIHPPSLYIGFTSCAVPFAFAIAALATGRLDNEWIVASRKWMLFSFTFLAIGNALGMLWAYEELGWGGYWAWDPVENAAFFPFLTATAYVHSIMIQERRGMLKMWNVILICTTFFLTYFGTFLTRSGLIASVHSFAQSGIGIFFVWYMVLIIAVCATLIIYRAAKLRSDGNFESLLSREIVFLANNWILLFLMIFIVTATVWPRISEWLLRRESTVGAPFYNTFVPPVALLLLLLMGVGPLLGWRKSSPQALYKALIFPGGAMLAAIVGHLALGKRLGFPAFVEAERIFDGRVGAFLAWLQGKLPLITIALVAFNVAVVLQEFYRGVRARRLKREESVLGALFRLVAKNRRRYGGYIVHVGVACAFLGFAGRSWGTDAEVSLSPGESTTIEEYTLTYQGPGSAVDHEKRVVYAEVDVVRNGKPAGRILPSRFIYKASPMQPSTEPAFHHTLRNDLYITVGIVNTQSKLASFQIHVNPLVSFVWLGVILVVMGAIVCMWPELSPQEEGAFAYVRALGSVAALLMISLLLALAPSQADAQQQQKMDRKGVVAPKSEEERAIFKNLKCNCGDCPHEPLSTCTCSWAHEARDRIRQQLAAGLSRSAIIEAYAKEQGGENVEVQPDAGAAQALWIVPIVLALGVGGLVVNAARRWAKKGRGETAAAAAKLGDEAGAKRDAYDEKLDQELRDLGDDGEDEP